MENILHNDILYGCCEITEPAAIDIIASPFFQRLRHIDQGGYAPLFAKPYSLDNKEKRYEHSRFTHSIGVFLLLRSYKAPFEEQIAGLLHDISHSAFSHCIDYVLDSGSETLHTHQDNFHNEYILKTDIPDILKKYGFPLDYILDDKNFPLKERELPDLCADRIDYSLRTARVFEENNPDNTNFFLANLRVQDKTWYFADYESAKRYALLFRNLNETYYAGIHSAIMFRAVGDALKYALQKNYINQKDLYTTDDEVIEKIKRKIHLDDRLSLLWKRMNNTIHAKNNPENYESSVFCKSRIVDPYFAVGSEIKRISDVDPEWKEVLIKESRPKKYFIQFEK